MVGSWLSEAGSKEEGKEATVATGQETKGLWILEYDQAGYDDKQRLFLWSFY